jgi:hypothetical protein
MKVHLLGLLFCLVGLGCSSGGAPDAAATACQNSPITPGSDVDVSPFQTNMAALSSDSSVQVVLVESNPSPPPVAVQTTWTIQVNDGSGNPLPNATVAVPLPYMPFHGHYTDQTPTVQQGSNGQWTISDLYFFMPGVWQITIQVTNNGAQEDALFHLCLG